MSNDKPDWLIPTLVSSTAVGGYYYLEKLLSGSAWAIRVAGSWQLQASGWSLLLYCWPILVAGVVAGWFLFEFLQFGLWERTRGRRLTQLLIEEKSARANARRQARAELMERELLVIAQERAVQEREAAMDVERSAWHAHNSDMQHQLDHEHVRANSAESKLRNANGAAERYKRRANKSGMTHT